MKEYKFLLQCIKSGQVSAKQIVEHLKDKQFANYWRKNV